MVKHIVMWRLKPEAHGNSAAENALLIRQKLEGLRGRIEGMLTIEVGLDFSRSDRSADIVLYSEFVDRDALSGYQAHPEHEAVKPFIVEAVSERQLADYDC